MNKKAIKKVLASILTMSMVLGLVGVGNLSGKAQIVKAETSEIAGVQTRTVNLQIDGDIAGITNPTVPTDTTSAWAGSKVYFGKYNNNPLLFRVLDVKTTDYSADGTTETMLLDSDILFAAKYFNQAELNTSWASSDIKIWMQGTGANQFLEQFSAIEKDTIIASNKNEPSITDGTITAGTSFVPLENDTVFALDAVELKNTSYGYSDTEDAVTNRIKKLGGKDNWWWTRSPYHNGNYVRFVHTTGKIANAGTPNANEMSLNPAMNLNLSSILFTSVSGQDKTSSFTTTETSDSNTWNLTLAGGKGFSATLSDSVITLEEEINVDITNLGTDLSDSALTEGYYSQLSAILVEENGTVLAYGKVGEAITGNVSFELPSGVRTGKYTLKVFAEKVNSSASSNATDYASNMASFVLNVVETRNINLQVNGEILGIVDPVAAINTTSPWSGSKVYFGQYGNNPVLFRVLDAKTTDYSADGMTETMLLDSDAILEKMPFNSNKTDILWQNSGVKTWMQDQFLNQFSAIERSAIIASNKNEPSATDGTIFSAGEFSSLENDTVFALDVAELRNTSYGYSNTDLAATNRIKQLNGAAAQWWTRSPLSSGGVDYVSLVQGNSTVDGKIGNAPISSGWSLGVSPAMNLDLSSILYAAASGVTQTFDLATVGTDLVANNIWKLTLLDDSKTVGMQEGKSVYQRGTTVTVPYTYSGSDISQLSIMITSTERTDVTAEVLYYGALTTVSGSEGSGSATFELPADLPAGYRIYLFAEDVNEGNFTNYASEPVELGIVISEEHTTDFATFRDEETMEAPVAPKGYVFAGWYYDEACTSSPVSSSTKELEGNTKVYAKFVPEAVLSVKAQSRYTQGNTNKIDLRLVTTVDSLKYGEVGFVVTNRAGTARTYKQQYVYQSLKAAGVEYEPTFFDACSIRFGTINISGITISGEGIDSDRTIPTRAYWITLDGTTVYGSTREVKVSEAVAILESTN